MNPIYPNVLNVLYIVISIGVPLALLVMVVSFIGMIVRWKTPKRRGHVTRLVVATVMIPCQIGLVFGFIWLIYLPEFSRHQMAEYNALRDQQLADA